MRSRIPFLVPVCLMALTIALVIGLPQGTASPENDWNLESRIPASSLGWVSLEDVGSWEKRFEQTAISGLFNDPEMKEFTAPIEKALREMLEAPDGPMGEMPPMVRSFMEQLQNLKGQLAVALVDLDLDRQQPHLVMSLDFGPHLEDFVAFLRRLKTELGEDGDRIETFERDGRTWWQVDTGGPRLTATTVDTAFVMATGPDLLGQVLTAEDAAGSLKTSSAFAYCRDRSGGDALGLFAFANAPALLEMFEDEMPRDAQRIARVLGLDTLKGVSYGMAFKGDGFMDSLILHTPGADHGLTTLDLMPAAQPTMLDAVPANAFLFAEASYNFSTLMPGIRDLVTSVDEDVAKKMDELLEEASEMVGVDIERELMPVFSQGLGYYASMPQGGGMYPEFALMCNVKDPATFEATFSKFMNGLAGVISEEGHAVAATRTMDYKGTQIHMMDLMGTRRREVIPFTPSWAVVGNRMVATAVPYTLKDIINRQASGQRAPGLDTQEDFQALMAHRPANAGSVSYLDLQAIMSLAYDTLVPLAQTAAKPNLMRGAVPFELDWAKLPPASQVRKHFRSMASFGSWNRDGIEISIHAPIPMVLVMGIAIGAGALFFMRGMEEMGSVRAVEMPREVDMGRLNRELAEIQGEELARYVRLFKLEKERLPTSLDELVKEHVLRSLPKDPWDNAYKLKIKEGEKREFAIVSAGADGQIGTPDDITVGGN